MVVPIRIVTAPDVEVDPAAMLDFLRAQLPKHMVPEVVHRLDALPLTASGKVAKAELRELLAERRIYWISSCVQAPWRNTIASHRSSQTLPFENSR